jgi:hypothetical protein
MQKTISLHDTIVPMIKSVNISNIFGKWNINVDTPFGEQNYTLSIDGFGQLKGNDFYLYYEGLSGSIQHEKGTIAFSNAQFEGVTFHCSVKTEFPISSTISITADLIEDNKISGILEIDKYLVTSFIAVK